MYENQIFHTTAQSPRDQWVNTFSQQADIYVSASDDGDIIGTDDDLSPICHQAIISGLILGLHPANERRRCKPMLSYYQ